MRSQAVRSARRDGRVVRRVVLGLLAGAALSTATAWSSSAAVLGAVTAPVTTPVTTPVSGTIQEGNGAAGVTLGMSKSQVVARWGAPASCVVNSRGEFCSFRSPDGVERAQIRLVGGSAGAVAAITIPFSNPTWTTTRGVHVGSTAYPGLAAGPGQFDAAYRALVDPARSSYWSRYVPATAVAGQPRGTRFTLGWINEYLPDQYFAVTGITVATG